MTNILDLSLVEQIGITEREIARRLHRLDFGSADQEAMRAGLPYIEAVLDVIIRDFYATQTEDREVASLIGDSNTLSRLQHSMRDYITSLFRCDHDESYVNNRLRIGKVHKRIGVPPRLYMWAMANLESVLEREINAAASSVEAEGCIVAMRKLLLFDAQLVFDAYVNAFLVEMENAKGEVENYAADLGIRVDILTRHLNENSIKDPLTGLYNRRFTHDTLERECAVAKRHQLPLTLAFLDLNDLKPLNDTHGHEAGDRILRAVGESILATTRKVDIPARFGGDEFCIIMPRTDIEGAKEPLGRFINDFDARREHPITLSIGVVQTGGNVVDTPHELIRRADEKMYAAKARAKECGTHQIEG